jgi:hypothetical protein
MPKYAVTNKVAILNKKSYTKLDVKSRYYAKKNEIRTTTVAHGREVRLQSCYAQTLFTRIPFEPCTRDRSFKFRFQISSFK